MPIEQVRTLSLAPGDEFIILACDGIWDVMTNQEVHNLPSSVMLAALSYI